MMFILFLNVRIWKIFFHHISNLHQNIKFNVEKESNGELVFLDNGELAFLDTLLKQNNGKISALAYREHIHNQ